MVKLHTIEEDNSCSSMHVVTPEFEAFLGLHKYQLESSDIPKIFWESLERKLREQVFDAGDAFSLMKIDYGEDDTRHPQDSAWTVVVSKDDGVSESDPNNIFLIDHAWTFRANTARDQLRANPLLVSRLSMMMDLHGLDDLPEVEVIEKVFDEIWRYSQNYTVNTVDGNDEDRVPIWYIMDEFGSGIRHADEPSCRVVPFVHLPSQITYSLLFPLSDLDCDTQVTRDFAEGPEQDVEVRRALLLPWTSDCSFIKTDFSQTEPEENYFSGGRVAEILPDTIIEISCVDIPGQIKVYSEYSQVTENLNHPRFVITEDEASADILWYTHHHKDYAGLGEKFVNQFPYESVITVKDLLCVVCRRQAKDLKYDRETLETYPLWLPTTYNLKTELPEFVSYFQNREKKSLDNHWICKPWNLARGLDTHVTKNLNFLLRLPLTGPKIAQKYVENPILFDRPGIGAVKFDIRYVVLLRSVKPLMAYVYKEFFVRFANLPYELTGLHEYERHFTVMNYENPEQLCHMKCQQFVELFEQQQPSLKWADIEVSVLAALREALEGATSQPPPRGIPHSPQSRALYAADLMLTFAESEGSPEPVVQPKLLEINWMPDCQRACQYYPSFYNDIFSVLFLDETEGKNVIPV